MAQQKRVLVADDHPLYRAALVDLFERESDFSVIGAADSVVAALDLLERLPCDLVLLDVEMPGMAALAGLATLHERWPDLRIALISGNLDAALIASALAKGATGFLPKTFESNVIVAAARLVLAGAVYVPHDLQGAAIPAAAPREERDGRPKLTAREIEILTHMAAGSAHKEIARLLGIAEVTVKLHAQRITRKLGARNRSAAIAIAIKAGLIDIGD